MNGSPAKPNLPPTNQKPDGLTIRSMARDLEAVKRGQPPPNIPTILEPRPAAPTPPPASPPPPPRGPASTRFGEAGPPAGQARPTPPAAPPRPVVLPPPLPPAPPPVRPPILEHPPLPPTPVEPLPRPRPRRPRKLILLGVVAAAILLFIIGEIWWFFIRPEPEPTVPTETLLPPPEEIVTTPPEEEPTLEPIPASLLNYAKIEDVEIASASSQAVLSALTDFINRPRSEGELVRLALRLSDGRIVNFETLEAALGLTIPVEMSNLFTGEFDFFLLGKTSSDQAACVASGLAANECAGPRLGLALKVSNPSTLTPLLRAWEQTMAVNLQSLIIPKVTIGEGAFSSNTYKGVRIRYRNFPIHTTTIDYAVSGDTLLITTSKNSMFVAIEALLK